MNSVSFEIPGEPIGQGRPRAAVVNGKPRLYTPKKSSDWRIHAQRFMAKAMGSNRPWTGDVQLTIKAYFQPPKTLLAKWKRDRLFILRPSKTPDWDNVGKAVCDAANGIVWKDDAQVVYAQVNKFYAFEGESPKVVVEARELK